MPKKYRGPWMSDPETGEGGVDRCTLPTTITSTYVCEREREREGARNRVIGFQILPKPSITKVLTPPQCMLSYRGSWLGELRKQDRTDHTPATQAVIMQSGRGVSSLLFPHHGPGSPGSTLSVLSCHFYAYRLEK